MNGLSETAFANTAASKRAPLTGLARYFLLTFALAWVLWFAASALVARTTASPVRALLFLPGTFAPAIGALWMTYRSSSSLPRGEFLARLFQWQVPMRWYLFAVTYMVVVKLSAAAIFRLSEGTWPIFGSTPLYILILATVFSAPVQAGEEIGWRGYALPRLGDAIGFPAASLILGLIWALWHLPLFLIANTGSTGQPLAVYVLTVTAISVAMTWLFLNTNGSLLPVMLMHAAINNTTGIVPSSLPDPPGAFSLHASSIAWITIAVLWAGAAYFLAQMARGHREQMPPHGITIG